jgi:hypothetical protein
MSILNNIQDGLTSASNLSTAVGGKMGNVLGNRINAFNTGIASYVQGVAQVLSGDRSIEDYDLPYQSRLMMFRLVGLDGKTTMFPHFVLPVNPEQFVVKYRKRNTVKYTFGGFVIQHWHDDTTLIDTNGSIPSFMNKSKVLTNSYQTFLKLLDIYKKAGQVEVAYRRRFNIDTINTAKNLRNANPDQGQVINGLAANQTELEATPYNLTNAKVQIIYQDAIYEGVFKTFNITESYDEPNTLKYSFTFEAVSQMNSIFGSLGEGYNIARTLGLVNDVRTNVGTGMLDNIKDSFGIK